MNSKAISPTHITVIIKGDRFQAAKAMSAAGIPFAFVREINGHGHHPETVGRVCPVYLPKIRELFHRDDNRRDYASLIAGGLPIGSILLWNEGWLPVADGKQVILDHNNPNALLDRRRII